MIFRRCHRYSFQCGDVGCGTSGSANGLGNTACCINGVLNSQPDCSLSGAAPCVITDGKRCTMQPICIFVLPPLSVCLRYRRGQGSCAQSRFNRVEVRNACPLVANPWNRDADFNLTLLSPHWRVHLSSLVAFADESAAFRCSVLMFLQRLLPMHAIRTHATTVGRVNWTPEEGTFARALLASEE